MPKKYQGLSNIKAGEYLQQFGPNTLPSQKNTSIIMLYFSQLKNPLMYVLLVAGLVTLFLKDFLDSVVIFLAVFINSLLGFFQEYKAQKTLEKLKNLLSPTIRVIRDGKTLEIDIKYLVPKDIVLLSLGDKIPADGKVLEAARLSVNEAILTGESLPLEKFITDKVFMGTTVLAGRGIIVIESTGKNTEIGNIAQTLQTSKEEPTPLQTKINLLAKTLALVVVFLSALVFILGVASQKSAVEMFTTSVAIAVSAIPEGLVVALTAILAVGMQRILKRKAVIRKLVSAETLGAVTVIACDKTGTLTEGEMKITDYNFKDKAAALKTACLANNLEDPLEIAIWDFIRKSGGDPDIIQEEHKRLDEIPFSPENKFMAVKTPDGIYLKGAPEIILNMCDLTITQKEETQQTLNHYSEQGLHTIALARRLVPSAVEGSASGGGPLESHLHHLTYLGLLGASDPVRPTVKEALQNCQKAGLKVIVVTGDYQKTAMYVLEKLGAPIKDPQNEVIDGKELEDIPEEELAKRIDNLKLFARVSPHQKLKIVKALKKRGEVVAVTGDGVNDALALKEADVGIVVNTASDVAKETADIVLLDSNFETIVAAIEEGRGIFDNIKRVVLYLLSDTFAEISLIALSLVLKLPLPITAAQILWINIIDDGLPTLALTIEPKSRHLLLRPPQNPDEAFLDAKNKTLIFVISFFSAVFALILFIYSLKTTSSLAYAQTMAFTFVAVSSLFYVFAARALTKPIYKVNPFKNPSLIIAVAIGFLLQIAAVYTPVLSSLFKTVPITGTGWLQIISLSSLVIFAIEATKAIFSKKLTP